MADDRTKRMRYFDRQFLRARDFQDEQAYHLDRRRRHNRLLHSSGIAGEGLQVKASTAPGEERIVLVSPGTAYDPQGQEIVLTGTPSATDRKLELSAVGITPGPPVIYGSPLYLTIAYDERPAEPSTDPGIEGMTRIVEEPKLEASIITPTDPNRLLLAVIQRNASDGRITNVDTHPPGRLRAGTLPLASVGPLELADRAIQSRHIALATPGTDQTPTLGSGVKTGHLQDGAVTELKLAANAVTRTKLANQTVTTEKLADRSVTQLQVAPGSISLRELKASLAAEGTAPVQPNNVTFIPPGSILMPGTVQEGFYIPNISIIVPSGLNASLRISWQDEYVAIPFGSFPIVGRQWRVTNLTSVPVTVSYKIYRIEES